MTEPLELAGDRMKMVEQDDGSAVITFDDVGTGRRCGGCTLCCKLLPVPPLNKLANVRCDFAKVGKGCTIYAGRPVACRSWSCRWLSDPRTAGLPRPDRAHYVIDLEYDTIAVQDDATGTARGIQVLQVWVDPAFRDAHHDPALRRYIQRLGAEYAIATLVRWSNADAMVVIPPAMTRDNTWFEGVSNSRPASREAVRALLNEPVAVDQKG